MKRCWLRWLCLALVWIPLGLATLHDATAQQHAAVTLYVFADPDVEAVYGRKEPDDGSFWRERFDNGQAVDVIGVSGNWFRIEIGPQWYCWLPADIVREYPPDQLINRYRVSAHDEIQVLDAIGGEPTGSVLNDGDMIDVFYIYNGWIRYADGWVRQLTDGHSIAKIDGFIDVGDTYVCQIMVDRSMTDGMFSDNWGANE